MNTVILIRNKYQNVVSKHNIVLDNHLRKSIPLYNEKGNII